MKMLWPLILRVVCLCLPIQAQARPSAPSQIQLSDEKIHIRPAVVGDLDDFTTVFLDAFSPGEAFRYLYPNYNNWRKYRWKCCREEIGREFAKMSNHSYVNVITVPTNSSELPDSVKSERVVSVSVWQMMEPEGRSTGKPFDNLLLSMMDFARTRCADNLDGNNTHIDSFTRQADAVEKHYIGDLPQKQLHLALLATHPQWDGHGFGPAQLAWGLGLAERSDVPVTLIATPAGFPLYCQTGFSPIANITIKTLDWPNDLWWEYMRYD